MLLSLHYYQICKGVDLEIVFSREPRIKANCLFGSHIMRKTSALEKASAD